MTVFLKILFSIFLVLLLAAGCASTQKPKATVDISQYSKGIVAIDLNQAKSIKSEQCPSGVVWKKSPWKKLIGSINACIKASQWNQVESMANHLAETEAMSPWGAYYLSLVAYHKKNYLRAMWMIDLALKKAPTLSVLYYQKSRIHWALNEHELSIKNVQKSMKMGYSTLPANLFLSQIYFRDQDYSKALVYLQKVIKTQPNNKLALTYLSNIYLIKRDGESAVEYLNQAIGYYPREASYRVQLAHVYESLEKDLEQALFTYRRIRFLRQSKQLVGLIKVDLNLKIKNLEVSLNKLSVHQEDDKRKPAQKGMNQ